MLAYEENPGKVERADLVVGLSSHNNAGNIALSTEQAAKGLRDHFGNKNSVIINCDNHSEDGTKEAFLRTPSEIPKIYLSSPPGMVGRGYNLRNLTAKAVELQAQSVIVVDASRHHRGHDQDLVGPAPLAPLPHDREPDLRRLTAGRGHADARRPNTS